MTQRGLLIVARNLGDAVITSGYLSLLSSIPNVKWSVLCRPEVAFLFEGQANVEKILSNRFPMGTDKKFNIREAIRLLRSLFILRKMRIDVSIDLLGDFREVGIARLIGSTRHYSPVWPEDHSFRKLIWPSPVSWIPNPCAVLPATKNIYLAYNSVIEKIVSELGGERRSAMIGTVANTCAGPSDIRVGFHPFASQNCKLWPEQNWHSLATSLRGQSVKVVAFGGPHEKERLKNLFQDVLPEEAFVCTPLSVFFEQIKTIDLLVGLDSLSVHAAHRVGTPSIMLIGANDPDLWAPPSCTPVTSRARCGNQPCFNVPSCQRTEFEFDCMKQISADAALDAVLRGLARKGIASDEVPIRQPGLEKSGQEL